MKAIEVIRRKAGKKAVCFFLTCFAVLALSGMSPAAAVSPEKAFSDSSKVNPGHWEITDEVVSAPVSESRQEGDILIRAHRPDGSSAPYEWYTPADKDMVFEFTVTAKTNFSSGLFHNCRGERSVLTVHGISGIKKSYKAGETCNPHFTISIQRDKGHTPGTVWGSLYFADVRPGSDPFGQEAAVREYFERSRSFTYAQELFQEFGPDSKTVKYGSTRTDEGIDDLYYDARCSFPRLTAEGDKIWLVMDFSDVRGGAPVMRNVWEYTWITDPEVQEKEEAEAPEDHSEDDPEWIRNEYPGHWDRTDIIYLNPGSETDRDGTIRVRSERMGVDLQDIVYHFAAAGKEEEFTVTIPEPVFKSRYYAGQEIYQDLEIYCDSDAEDRGYVICSLALADIAIGEGKYGVKVDPKQYFSKTLGHKQVKTFGPVPHSDTMNWESKDRRAKLFMSTSFPEGGEDGEKIWLVYGIMDSESGVNRLYNIYEYTWTKGPDVIWRYNPPMYS